MTAAFEAPEPPAKSKSDEKPYETSTGSGEPSEGQVTSGEDGWQLIASGEDGVIHRLADTVSIHD